MPTTRENKLLRLPALSAVMEFGAVSRERLRGFRSYRITLEGIALIGLMALIGLAAWQSGTNLLYLIFAMLLTLFLIHGAAVSLLLRRIEVSRRLPPHIAALQETEISLVVRNRRRLLSAFALRLVDRTAHGETVGSSFVVRVPAGAKVLATYKTVFPRRGRFLLRRIELTTRFPFGLAERGFSLIHPQEALVYPAMYGVEELIAWLKAESGDVESPKKGDGYDYYGLREYAPGDPARLIHWRSSARAQRLVVVEHEREERRQITLALLNTASDAEIADKQVVRSFETAVSVIASLARQFLADDYEVQLITASGKIVHGSGQGHLYRILRMLAELDLAPTKRSQPVSLRGPAVINALFRDSDDSASRHGTLPIDVRQWTVHEGVFRRGTSA